jgi:hypothetical protein
MSGGAINLKELRMRSGVSQELSNNSPAVVPQRKAEAEVNGHVISLKKRI